MIENEKLVSNNIKVANCLNYFFSNIVKNLEIPKYEVKDNFHQNIESPALKAVFKYRNHPSIISISYSFRQASSFNFSCIDKSTVLKEIRSLSITKTSRDTDLPLKVLKENTDYSAEFICIQFNEPRRSSKFPSSFKCAKITHILKINQETTKITTALSVSYL